MCVPITGYARIPPDSAPTAIDLNTFLAAASIAVINGPDTSRTFLSISWLNLPSMVSSIVSTPVRVTGGFAILNAPIFSTCHSQTVIFFHLTNQEWANNVGFHDWV